MNAAASQTRCSVLLRWSIWTDILVHSTFLSLFSLLRFLSVQGLKFSFFSPHSYCRFAVKICHQSRIQNMQQLFQFLMWSILNVILHGSNMWLCCGLVAGELLTYWQSDNDSSVWDVQLLPCLFLSVSYALSVRLSVSFRNFTFCLLLTPLLSALLCFLASLRSRLCFLCRRCFFLSFLVCLSPFCTPKHHMM